MIHIQTEDFDMAHEYQALRNDNHNDGAIVTFTGLVRDVSVNLPLQQLTLEHYPGMTEKSLTEIVSQAKQRWPLGNVRLIHRVGSLNSHEQIVFVGVTSKHRQAAFQACEFIMDFLKNQAPFWKKETTEQGEQWVDAKQTDQQALSRW